MIIGIDASRLTEQYRTGTENYLYNVVKNFAQLDTTNTFILYTRHIYSEQFLRELFCGNSKFSYKMLPKTLSWTQYNLAKATFTDKLDVLFAPWQTIPIIKNPKTRVVSVIHGFEYKSLRFGPTYFSIIFSNKVVAVSKFTYTNILRILPFAFIKSKSSVVYEGVDTSVFTKHSSEQVEITKTKYDIKGKYVLSVGTVNGRKNLTTMLKSFALILEHGTYSKSLSFIIAGKISNEYKAVLNLPKQLGIEKNVKFLGYVPNNELVSLYSGAEFLSFVSISEGFGLPVLEALACKCPVLTSISGALGEVGGKYVLYADPNSIESVKDGMLHMLDNSNTMHEEGDHFSLFSWNECSRKLLELLTRK